MTPAQWARVTTVFGQAREQHAAERASFVERACADDPDVRTEVLALLAADLDDSFLERGAPIQPVDLLDDAGGHAFAPGDPLGHYRIERLLARGGMGVIYLGTDVRLGRQVVLKVLPAAMTRDPRARERLQREARTAAVLRHPHIVSVHALEEIGDVPVIVSEYVEGPTLAQVLADEGPLPPTRWRLVARSLADALAAAHAAQVIHRDVKSSNVVLGRDGLRLVDFGIALGQANGGDTRMTRAGQMAGTPLAQAPEQLEGGQATPLSDQYAFGLVLYEAACGRLPFGDGPIAGVWARMLRDEPIPLSAQAPHLDVADVLLVHRCLSRRPEDRFSSMQAVADALANPGVTTADGIGAVRPAVARETALRWWEVHHAVTAALYVVLLWPGWIVASTLPAGWRGLAHLSLICIAAVVTSLRLHLWFSTRHYPPHVANARHRLWPILTLVDVLYAALLGAMALYAADARIVPAVITAGLAVCLVMASLVIEPATRGAASRPEA